MLERIWLILTIKSFTKLIILFRLQKYIVWGNCVYWNRITLIVKSIIQIMLLVHFDFQWQKRRLAFVSWTFVDYCNIITYLYFIVRDQYSRSKYFVILYLLGLIKQSCKNWYRIRCCVCIIVWNKAHSHLFIILRFDIFFYYYIEVEWGIHTFFYILVTRAFFL